MMKFLNIAVFVLAFVPVQAQVQMLFSSDSLFNITSPLAIDSIDFWFEADQGVTDSLGGAIANNEGVGTWNDLSGNGHHLTQGSNIVRPVYKTGEVAGYPAIQLDGSNDWLASAAYFWGSDDITVIVVMKFANASRNLDEAVVVKNEATGNTRQWGAFGRSQSVGGTFNLRGELQTSSAGISNSQLFYSTNNWKHTNWKVHSWVSTGSAGNLYDDGSDVTSSGTTTAIYNSSVPKLSVGATNVINAPASFLQGTIAAIVGYRKNLSTAERAALETYFNKKYDLY